MKAPYAVGIIDAQRGFMPAEEGIRLGIEGFGELPISDGEKIVANVNALLGEAALHAAAIFTTQDWHPEDTAHFADEPNYDTTWPRHCVANTPGAELHPEIVVPPVTIRILKGIEALERGEDDNSYSGYNGYEEQTGRQPAEYLRNRKVRTLFLGGLALEKCVGLSAIDFREKMEDLEDVVVVTDATKPITTETGLAMLDRFKQAGIRTATTKEILQYMQAA